MAKAKTRAANLRVPQTDGEAEQMVARIGVLHRQEAAARAEHDGTIALIEERFASAEKARCAEADTLIEALKIWAEANRDRLTQGGRTKTVQLATGEISWKFGTPSVSHRGLKVDDVIGRVRGMMERLYAEAQQAERERHHGAEAACMARYRALGLFLRTKTNLDKEAMHANRTLAEQIEGVSFTSPGESFHVEPLASQIREVA